jgi:hypothetical protein
MATLSRSKAPSQRHEEVKAAMKELSVCRFDFGGVRAAARCGEPLLFAEGCFDQLPCGIPAN